jgi:hypothetical protein
MALASFCILIQAHLKGLGFQEIKINIVCLFVYRKFCCNLMRERYVASSLHTESSPLKGIRFPKDENLSCLSRDLGLYETFCLGL